MGGSPFWHSIHKIKGFFKLGAKFALGEGSRIRFWTDWWTGSAPLQARFPRLFAISSDPAVLVSQAFHDGWDLRFRRVFGEEEANQWTQLRLEIEDLSPSVGQDSVSWALEAAGVFSSHSLYMKLVQGATVLHANDIWAISVPLKVRIFLWQLARGRLPSNEQIQHRHGKSDGKCSMCGQPESVDHIFFSCVLPRFAWSATRSILGVAWNPSSFADWFAIIQRFRGNTRRALWVLFACQCWALWTTRNKFTIESKFPKKPANVLFKMLILLQQWRPLRKAQVLPLTNELERLLKAIYVETSVPSSVASLPT